MVACCVSSVVCRIFRWRSVLGEKPLVCRVEVVDGLSSAGGLSSVGVVAVSFGWLGSGGGERRLDLGGVLDVLCLRS